MSYVYTRIAQTFERIFSNIYFPAITFYDVLEIALIVIIIYFSARAFKNTRTWILIKSIFVFGLFYIISYLL
jgi:hypothetical protein